MADEYEHSKLFMVYRDSYERCFLNGGERQLGVCSSPDRQSSITLVFREFSPLPSAFTFKPGHSYFVITTSNGTLNGLNNTQGGLCSTRNMRLKFDVLPSISSNENDLLDNQQQLTVSEETNTQTNLLQHHRHSKHHHHHKSKEKQNINLNNEENLKELITSSHPPFLYIIHTDNDDKQSKIIFGAEEGHSLGQEGNLENLDLTTIFNEYLGLF
uniref:Ephrin RBD domain-containing protein n=1 Tax=Meloidogyne hapla TaxID=6305 RepID=A0A1I8BVJ9_MELHA